MSREPVFDEERGIGDLVDVDLRSFGLCQRSVCVNRSMRCVMGYCRTCCCRDHDHYAAQFEGAEGSFRVESRAVPLPLASSNPTYPRADKAETAPAPDKKPEPGGMVETTDPDYSYELGTSYSWDEIKKEIAEGAS